MKLSILALFLNVKVIRNAVSDPEVVMLCSTAELNSRLLILQLRDIQVEANLS